jgi:hypothetical protein
MQARKGRLTMPAIFSSAFVSHRRHPSRLCDPPDSLRSAWTGPAGDAKILFPHTRKWQALCCQSVNFYRLPLVGAEPWSLNRRIL